jgi:D-alanyl-D-alanine carboxypeptidase
VPAKKQVSMKKQLLKAHVVAVFTTLLFSISAKAQFDSQLATQLQQILNTRVQNFGNNGVSACVIMPDGSTWKGTAGVGQNSLAITDSTVFHGASITKANIAVLLLMLAENGLLSLDSSWNKYVNLNVNFNPSITIRQLLNHSSGIADYLEVPGNGTLVTNNFNYAYTPAEILENIVSGTPQFAPGTNYMYSTSNYVLAALIAQTVTGNPVQQELHSRIWDPLGMTHTYFGGFESYTEPRAGVWWDFGNGQQNYSNNPETSMLTYGYGGANIVSTPGDLALFARALFTGTLLSQASLNQMKVYVPSSYSSSFAGYGLGIHHASVFGSNNVLGHDGYYTNLSNMFHSYNYDFTLVTMTNTQTDWFAIFNQMYTPIKNRIIALGTPENMASPGMRLFPNPTDGRLTLYLDNTGQDAEISIADLTGKIIYTAASAGTQQLELDTKDFSTGVYAVKVQTADYTGTKKLVVTK